MTLRTRLALGSAAATAVVVTIVAALVYVTVRDSLRGQVDDQLRARATAIVPLLGSAPFEAAPATAALRVPAPPLGRAGGLVQVVSPTGAPLGTAAGATTLPIDAAAREIAAGRRPERLRDVEVGGARLRVLATPVEGVGAVQIALPLDDVDSVLERLRWAMALIGLGGVAAAGLLGALAARAALGPVRRLDRTAQEVAHTADLTRRIDVPGTDEVGRLAGTFNEMMASLERSRDDQRRLVMDASHELRTPLTALRTNIEVLAQEDGGDTAARRRLLGDVTAQLEDLSRLMADVVSLARGSEPQEALEEVRLDHLVGEAVARAARDAPGLDFRVDAVASPVRAAPAQIARAVANLLDNAAKWSPPGATIDVGVADGEVTVRDRGPGIADEDLPHVFDRFYRAASARRLPGSGLGLAIVHQAAEAHGGVASAEPAPGGGALLRLRLPREDGGSSAISGA